MSNLQDKMIASFKGQYHLYEAFTNKISSVLRDLIDDAGIEYSLIESRTKSVESFGEKILREDKINKYQIFDDITDISGVRIIAFLKEDCEKISDIIRRRFEVDIENSIDKDDDFDPDKFGYRSIHYVVSFDADRVKIPEYSRFSGLMAEIQIRTILQHTWAAIDWKFRYKNENEAPRELRRRLYRISALLDAADDEFSLVTDRLRALKVEYTKMMKKGNYAIQINIVSFAAYIDISKHYQDLLKKTTSVGFAVITPKDNSYYTVFKKTMKTIGVKTIADLDKYVAEFLDNSAETLPQIKSLMVNTKTFTPSGIVRLAVIMMQTSEVRQKIFELAPMGTLKPQEVAGLCELQPLPAKSP